MRLAALAPLLAVPLLALATAQPPDWDPYQDGTCPHAGYCAPCPDPQAETLGDGSIRLTWTANPRVVTWAVSRGLSENDTSETVAEMDGSATSWTDTNVTAGTTYYYRLHGLSDSGLGGHCSDALPATAGVPQTEVPVFPSGVALALAGLGVVGAATILILRRQ